MTFRRGDGDAPLAAADTGWVPGAVSSVDDGSLAAGDSREQRHAERVMLELLGERLGVVLKPRRIPLMGGVRVEVDGADDGAIGLGRGVGASGTAESRAEAKVLADAFKLLHVAAALPVAPRLVLCLCDPQAAHHFTAARSWAAQALRTFAIEVAVVELPTELQIAIRAAQQRQYREDIATPDLRCSWTVAQMSLKICRQSGGDRLPIVRRTTSRLRLPPVLVRTAYQAVSARSCEQVQFSRLVQQEPRQVDDRVQIGQRI